MGSRVSQGLVTMFTARQKIKKEKGEPTELGNQVAQAFVDLEINNEELRPFLKNLHIAGAKEVVVNKSTAAIVSSCHTALRIFSGRTRCALRVNLRRSLADSMSCWLLSVRSRTRNPVSHARLPRVRSAHNHAP